MFFNPGDEATYLIPFDGKDDSAGTYTRECYPIGTGIAYRYGYETLDYRTKAITHPVAGMRIEDYFSEFNRRALIDDQEGVLFWSDGETTYTCPLSRVFSKAPPPFCFCASAQGSKHYDCARVNWLDVYKGSKDRGYYTDAGMGLIPIKTNSFFPEVYMRAVTNYYANYDCWGLHDGQWLKDYIRDDIHEYSPSEFMDRGVTINGARAFSAVE